MKATLATFYFCAKLPRYRRTSASTKLAKSPSCESRLDSIILLFDCDPCTALCIRLDLRKRRTIQEITRVRDF